MKKYFNQKGFSLTELLVVLVIIMLLIAIAAPVYASVRRQARETAFDGTVKNLKVAAELFVMENPGQSVIWSPFPNQKAQPQEGLAVQDTWQLYLERWPENPLEPGGTFSVEISRDGSVRVTPDVAGE